MHPTSPEGSVPSARSAAPLDLRLTIRSGSLEMDGAVLAQPWATVGELIQAFEPAWPGLTADASVQLGIVHERSGTWLEPERRLDAAGLLDGDRLVVGRFADLRPMTDRAAGPPTAAVDLSVRGGPRAGERIPLASGSHVIGRDPRAAAVAFTADSSMSGRHLVLHVEAGGVAVEDLGSTNGTFVDGAEIEAGVRAQIAPGSLLEAGRTSMSWTPARGSTARLVGDGRGGIVVHRPPRIGRPWEPPTLTLEAPPEAPRRVRIPILASVLPVLAGVAMAALLKNPAMLLFALLGPVVAIASRLEERGVGSREYQRRARAFREQVAALEASLDAALAAETEARRAEAPDAGALLPRVEAAEDLWPRRPSDADVLDVRIGAADQPARARVTIAPGGSPDLRVEAETAVARHGLVHSVPVIVPLAHWGSVGIVGTAERVDGLARWMVLQAAILQPPSELRIRAALGPARLHGWDWLKWLPHARPSSGGAVQAAVGAEHAAQLLESLAAESGSGPHLDGARTLLLIDGSLTVDARLVARLLAASAAGIVIVWLADDAKTLPNGIASIVRMDAATARLDLVDVASGTTVTGASADGVTLALADQTARAMAPLRDQSEAAASAGIPRAISLLAATGADLSTEGISRVWRVPAARTAVGATAAGPFTIDLAHDGPHMLVGGTTGSGKSELLQSLVTGLALSSPPSLLSFLLVDYKGGAAFREAASLPHVAGFVTDLDEHLARRALVSLEAELKRREVMIKAIGAKDIDSAFARNPAATPARLVIVIDEFAALAREVPEFVDGVVDVAERGRSLGVHLVLATQRPAGSVTPNIRTNTNLRIALRVTDAADSSDVIGIPDAATISRDLPGRAIARIGQDGAPIEFQAAWSGARVASGSVAAVTVRRFELGSPAELMRTPKGSDGPEVAEGGTELAAIVEAIRGTAEQLGVPAAPSPWLPALPAALGLAAVPAAADPAANAVFGLVDDPAHQRQDPLALDLDREGSMLIYGAGGSGRTTALRSIAVALAAANSPADLHLYGLDFGAGGLRLLEDLPHVGSVVAGSDEEHVARLFTMLRDTLETRQRLFAERRAHGLGEARAALGPGEQLPRIVLLLDGYAAFTAAFERVQFGELVELIPRLVTDGRAVGIHMLITAERRGSVPSRLAGVVNRRLVLRLADESEYGQLGLDRRVYQGLRLEPGRGLTEQGLEAQVATPTGDPSAQGQRSAIAALGERSRASWPGVAAPPVRTLPSSVRLADLGAAVVGSAVLGMADRTLGPAPVALEDGHFLIAGPLRSGRSTALASLASSLAASTPRARLHLLAPRRSPLQGLPFWVSSALGTEACDALVERLAGDPGSTPDSPLVLVVDDADELFESASSAALATLARRGRDTGVRIIAASELRSALRAYGGWLAEVRKDRHGLLLQPGQEMAGELLGTTLPRAAASRPMGPGRGFLVVRGGVELIQVAQP